MSTVFRRHIYQDQTNGEGGGGGAQAIDPVQAREFASQFIHDPKVLESWDDKAVLDYHGRLNQSLDKVRPKGAFPDNWREELAKGPDGKPLEPVMKRLLRYTNPKAVADALMSVQERISAGELRSQLPKDATPEQVKAWRAENGVPESPDKYEIKLPTGITIGEDDRPIIDGIFAEMHSAGLSNAMASKFVESYYKVLEKQVAVAAHQVAQVKKETEDKLRASWGADYRANTNLIDAIIAEKVPAGSQLATDIKEAMATKPEFAEFMAAVARTINPVTTIIPGANSENIPQAIDSEIAAIDKDMALGAGNKSSKYYNGPVVEKNGFKDTEMAHRYRELVEARDRAKSR